MTQERHGAGSHVKQNRGPMSGGMGRGRQRLRCSAASLDVADIISDQMV